MAKARFTERGNIRVVMTPSQYEIIMQILNHVRLGNRNEHTSAISDFVIDLEDFNNDAGLGGLDETSVQVFVNRELPDGSLREVKEFIIELTDAYDNAYEDDEDDYYEDDDE